jgi:hypothetical protein
MVFFSHLPHNKRQDSHTSSGDTMLLLKSIFHFPKILVVTRIKHDRTKNNQNAQREFRPCSQSSKLEYGISEILLISHHISQKVHSNL